MMTLAREWCDGDAVQRVLAGDTRAFEALVERHQRRVYRFIRRQVSGAGVAEDLAQETFLQAYRVLASFRSEARFSTWLLGIARNIVLNSLNRDWRAEDLGDDEADAGGASGRDPAMLVLRDEALVQLQDAVERLPGELRECLLLAAVEDLDYDEVAGLLGIPAGTVKSRLSRARAQLRATLGPDFFSALRCSSGTFP